MTEGDDILIKDIILKITSDKNLKPYFNCSFTDKIQKYENTKIIKKSIF